MTPQLFLVTLIFVSSVCLHCLIPSSLSVYRSSFYLLEGFRVFSKKYVRKTHINTSTPYIVICVNGWSACGILPWRQQEVSVFFSRCCKCVLLFTSAPKNHQLQLHKTSSTIEHENVVSSHFGLKDRVLQIVVSN